MSIQQGTNFFSGVTSTLDSCLVDENKLMVFGKCTGVPPTTAGVFQHGCLLIRTDSGTGTAAIYENQGSTAVPSWNLVGSTAAGDISLAEGNILIGNASGVATSLNAKTSGRIIVGDGTTVASVAVSGDATLSSAGAVTIANAAVSPAKQSTAARTRTAILPFKLPAPTGANQGPFTTATFAIGEAITIVAVKISSDIATSGSDATNNYSFMPRNLTAAANLHTSPTTTQGAELSTTALKSLTLSQNLTFTADQVFAVDISIADDGSAGPTNLSGAQLYAVLTFTI